ncbi:CIC11C00000005645 [Sungouiella intermedia]|uniref:DNA repair protein RAD50 n=1 Tax=Sungouiella intermedia TaxID=45354 RepID=A0A1L0BW01_9ASCO|nr:CIC11C00000005645 [[Candida] intermedia]
MNARLESTNAAFSEMELKIKNHKNNILAVLEESEVDEYERLLQELEDDHKSAVYNLNTFEVTKSYKVKAMDIAKKTRCCTLCNRGFNGGELSKFETELQNNINSLTADKFTDDVEATMKDLQEMKNIHFDILQYRKLTKELQQLKTEAEIQRESIREKESNIKLEKTKLEQMRFKLEQIRELTKPVEGIHRVFGEIANIESQLLLLQDELEEFGSSVVTVSELQREQQKKNFEVKNLRQAISDATEEINSLQRELSKLESQVKDKQLLISDMERAFSEAVGLKNSIADSETHVKSLQEKQEKIGIILQDLRDNFKVKSEEYEDLKNLCTKQEDTSRSMLDDLSSTLLTFERILEAIESYELNDKEQVEQIKEKLTETTTQVQNLEHSKSELELEIKQLEAAINDATKVERNIQDNVELRQTENELDRIQQTLNEIDIQNAEVEKEKYQAASQKLRSQITDLNSQHFGKVGEVKQINDQIQHLQNELSTEFKNIDKQYHSEWIKLQTNLLVSNDLQTYSQALDNAIMKYHSMKMDEINRILRELWNQTYRGTDIDGIEIKCDVAKGRSYNYRVVMYKKNSELDMRGRCSAGQKVLTSILIRLALAECFGTNCGMIALDEPTTNLDVENAESLAMALNNIIDFRKTQKNFQLIVITHDEQFLSHINGDRYTDNFYRIERDENQNSIIKSLPIHLMQDD